MNFLNRLLGSKIRATGRAFARVVHGFLLSILNLVRVGGLFKVECFAPDGTLRWTDWAKNGVTAAGLDDLLNTYFRAGTPKANWYVGAIDNAGFTNLGSADTMASHAGWAELTSYSNGNRPAWGPGASSGQSLVNATTCDLIMTAQKTVRGLILVSDNTIGGTAGLLWATAQFSGGNQSVNPGDTLKCTYTVSGASG